MAAPRVGLATFLILWVFFTTQLWGAPIPELPKATATYLFDSWKLEQGLPQISVFALAQDQQGYLWLGTEEGLVRFDGQRFKVFDRSNTPGFRSHFIQSLLADPDGSLWIGTQNGLGHWERGQLTLYTASNGLPDPEVRALYRDRKSQLWVGTTTGLSRWDGKKFVAVSPGDEDPFGAILAIQEDFDGGLWLGTEKGLRHFGRQAEEISRPSSSAPGILSMAIHTLAMDRRGRLWFGTLDGLYCFEAGNVTGYSVGEGLPHPTVRSLYLSSDDSLWVGTEGGLSRLDPDRATEGMQESLTRKDGLADHWIASLQEDHEGTLWVGTRFGGLNRLRSPTIRSFGTPEGLVHDLVWGVNQDRAGNVWVATDEGLSRLQPDGTVTSYTPRDGLPDPASGALYEDLQGNLWIGTFEHGLVRFREGVFRVFTPEDGFPPVRVRRLLEDAEGRFFIATNGGLFERTEAGFTRWTVEDGLPHAHIRDLHADPEGGLWLATDGGLARFQDGEFTSFPSDQDLLTEERIKSIYGDDQGVLWLGTWERGLARFENGSFEFISVQDGLHHHRIHRTLEDGHGWLWMSSNRGVFRVLKDELNEFASGRRSRVHSVAYDESDGMRSRECNGGAQPAGVRTRDGRLWFATIAGVVVVDPQDLTPNRIPPPVQIEEVSADQESFLPRVGFAPGPVEFLPHTREFEVHFVALSFRAPEKNRYQYKLEGFDSHWVDASGRRSAHYTNLEPGTYRFRVIAANNDGVWNEEGASFEFYLRPAIYQTWYFLLVALLTVVSGMWILHRMRIRYVLHQKIEQSHIQLLEAKNAEMEHFTRSVSHDLKTPLYTIDGYLDFLEQDLARDEPEKVPSYIGKIRTAVDRMGGLLDTLLELSHSGRVVNEPQQVQMRELVDEAIDLAAGLIAEKGVDVKISPDLPTVEGDPHRLLQVVQNLITNAVKFTGSEAQPKVEIGARQKEADSEGAKWVFYVRDNGVGIEREDQDRVFDLFDKLNPEMEGSGIGLALAQRIVEAHGGRIWVDSKGVGRGATFFFTLPAPQEKGRLV